MKPLYNGLAMGCLALFFGLPLLLFGGLVLLSGKTGMSDATLLAILLPLACGLVIASFFMGYRSQKKVDIEVQKEVDAWHAAQSNKNGVSWLLSFTP